MKRIQKLPRALVALVVVCLAMAALIFVRGDDQRTVVAHFSRAVSLFPGSEVRIHGVNVGEVVSVVPEGNTVRIDVLENPAGSPVEARVLVPATNFTVAPTGAPALDTILAEEAGLAATANAARDRAASTYADEVEAGMEPGCDEESSSALDAACDRLAAEDIPLSARLMALADVYDALRSQRVYKPAYPHERAAAEILEGRGGHFDPDVVDAFRALDEEFMTIARSYAE